MGFEVLCLSKGQRFGNCLLNQNYRFIMTNKLSIFKLFNEVLVRNLTLGIFIILLIIFRNLTTRPIYKKGDTVRISTTVFSDPISYAGSQGLKVAGITVYLPIFPKVS